MDQEGDELMSYCRQCGGERRHSMIAEKTRSWSDDDAPVDGSDTWSIIECGGCHTVTFVHSHWFSEDTEYTEDGSTPILHRDLYPPTPSRKMPEWGVDAYLGLKNEDLWVVKLHADIYAAVGMEAFALAAMGTRAIVDFAVTSTAGEEGTFKDKLNRMRKQHPITETQVEVIYAAFDAGSAAAHRGYSPTREEVFTLLDITESLLQQLYIDPVRQRRQAQAAEALKSKTPPRPKP
ncbi:MAG: DUF4145 domain-containing protein [Stellaceae bacterium]